MTIQDDVKELRSFLAPERPDRAPFDSMLARVLDQLARYEKALQLVFMVALPPDDVSGRAMWNEAREALEEK